MPGFRIHGERLRRLRTQALLTQEQLAQLADCSDRVIRKAEAGGTLRLETIELIVEALVGHGLEVTAEDLVGGNLLLAKQYVRALDRYGANLVPHFPHFSRQVRMHVAGVPDVIPFAGSWRGSSGVAQHLRHFFAVFRRKTCAVSPKYLETENEVSVKFTDRWQAVDRSVLVIWVNLHFKIRDSLITSIEKQYDTHVVHQHFAAALINSNGRSGNGNGRLGH